MKGYVYVLSNPSMPGLVKIGRSKVGGNSRGKQMYKGDTGVPTPFELEFECLFDDCIEAEAMLHDELSHLRVNPQREFFKMDEYEAVIAVLNMAAYFRDHFVEHCDAGLIVSDAKVHQNCDYSDEVYFPDWREVLCEVSAEEARPAWERVKARREKRLSKLRAVS
jgi:hypothetical protein